LQFCDIIITSKQGEKVVAKSSVELQLKELKDMVLSLNQTIALLNSTISDLNKKLTNKDLEIDYLKNKLYGSSSEKIKHSLTEDGQISLFDRFDDVEPAAVPVDVEMIEVKAHKRERKPKKSYDDLFKDLP
jgi:transposase